MLTACTSPLWVIIGLVTLCGVTGCRPPYEVRQVRQILAYDGECPSISIVLRDDEPALIQDPPITVDLAELQRRADEATCSLNSVLPTDLSGCNFAEESATGGHQKCSLVESSGLGLLLEHVDTSCDGSVDVTVLYVVVAETVVARATVYRRDGYFNIPTSFQFQDVCR